MLNQAQTVVKITKEFLGSRYQANVPVKAVLTPEDKKNIVDAVCEMFRDGQTGFNPTKDINAQRMADNKELRNYVVGLCNNHWRKHKELNGGVKYEPSYKRSDLQQAA